MSPIIGSGPVNIVSDPIFGSISPLSIPSDPQYLNLYLFIHVYII